MVGWDEHESFPEYTLHGQFARALRNTLQILAEDGAGPQHVVRMTCYVTDRHEYVSSRDEIGAAWREIMGAELSRDGAGRGEGARRERRQGRDRDDGGGGGRSDLTLVIPAKAGTQLFFVLCWVPAFAGMTR